jgi:galactokinase
MTYEQLTAAFLELYGGTDKDIRIFEAPGRINLIGEHIDYNGGHVFPAALEMKNIVVARRNGTRTLNMAVTSLPDRVSAEIDALEQCRRLPWGHYQCGVAWALVQAGYDITGCDLLYHGTVPYGAGLSSSASIEVATAVALAKLGGREELDMVEIARLCQRAENDYVGMNCGIMDQFAAAMGKKHHAIFLNCSTLEYRHVPLMLGSYTLVITNTNAPHKLTESQYNLRRAECERALEIINSNGGYYPNLCAVRMDELERYAGVLDGVLYRRARHCVSEEARTRQSIEALEAGDIAVFGKLLCDGHISMRDDYEATGAELDAVFDIAMTLDGVIGSRMTGGGFGGCGISIVKSDKVEACKQTLSEEYTRRVGYAPSFYQSNVGDGAREVVDWRQ